MTKKYKKKDPHQKREKAAYDNPVASREFIIEYLKDIDRPVSFKHLADAFAINSEEEREGIRRRLKAMIRDGQVMTNRRGSYALVKSLDLVPGRVEGHRDGFGYLIPDEGEEDIFLSERQMRGVFHGDRVLVRAAQSRYGKKQEGFIVEVLERNTKKLSGRFVIENKVAFVEPDLKQIAINILIPLDETRGAKAGDYVEVEIIEQPSFKREAIGRVTEVLGDHLTPGLEVELAIRSYSIPFEWDKAVIAEAKKLPKKVQTEELENRTDLRHLPFVTIDGEDAKDFDDAVFVDKTDEGFRLYVAIADVSHYVTMNSALDISAKDRATSVYFPSRVIPMLPEALSNELCSLVPNQDRLTMVCDILLNQEAEVINYRFYNAAIHSNARLTYNSVATLLENGAFEHPKLVPHINLFHTLYQKLHLLRQKRGAIDFDMPETRIIFDKNGKIEQIVPVQRNVAHKMIEEAMLLANVCAANFLEKSNLPILYRNHEVPDVLKIQDLRDFLKALSLRLTGGAKPHAKDFSHLLGRLEGRPDRHLVQTVMLRSLRQAMYGPENYGHFGLAYEAYTHFTSPIRRYPDLLVHRAIKHILQKNPKKEYPYNLKEMTALGEHCSVNERRADEATRDAQDWLKCDFMKHRVGSVFDGIISGVTGFGVFVELKEFYIEGLLHITALKNDYYNHDATHHALIGRKSGKIYRLGDPVRVLVARVDLDNRKIDFELPS